MNVFSNFTWIKNGSAITDTANILQTSGGALLLRNISHNDASDYTCLGITTTDIVGATAVLKVGGEGVISNVFDVCVLKKYINIGV